MRREFIPFDEAVIDAELDELRRTSAQDAAKLEYCVERYEESGNANPHPALIKSFDEGFKELRHVKDHYAGRLFYYERTESRIGEEPIQILVILRVFRKGGQDTPARELRTAEARMKLHRSKEDMQ